MQKYYKSLTWSSYDLPEVLKERGVHEHDKLPGFHYRDDALKLWFIIKEYIVDILQIYYHSDEDVSKVKTKYTVSQFSLNEFKQYVHDTTLRYKTTVKTVNDQTCSRSNQKERDQSKLIKL